MGNSINEEDIKYGNRAGILEKWKSTAQVIAF